MTDSRHRRLRILVVEDNGDIRQVLHDLLKSLGHDVSVVADGECGLEKLRNNTYDLLITDLGLPGMSGWELSRAAKRYQTGVQILAISSWLGRKAVMKIEDYGIGQVIWKPFRLDHIKKAIEQLCGSEGPKFRVNET